MLFRQQFYFHAEKEISRPEKEVTKKEVVVADSNPSDYDPQRGIGKWDESNVDVSSFDPAMAATGKKIAETKCT